MFQVVSAPGKDGSSQQKVGDAARRQRPLRPPRSLPKICSDVEMSTGLATDFYPSFRKFTTVRVDNVFDFDSADASGSLTLVNFDALLRSRLICKVVSFPAEAPDLSRDRKPTSWEYRDLIFTTLTALYGCPGVSSRVWRDKLYRCSCLCKHLTERVLLRMSYGVLWVYCPPVCGVRRRSEFYFHHKNLKLLHPIFEWHSWRLVKLFTYCYIIIRALLIIQIFRLKGQCIF